jgi:phosphatidyl-myo-inositol dimannoside synthase
MRLLSLSSEFPPGPGGIGTHAYQVALQLHTLGWEVTVISPQDYAPEGEIEAFNSSQPFCIVRLQPINKTAAEAIYRWRVISRWIRHWRPDVLLASGTRAVWLSAPLAARNRLLWLAVGHGTEFGSRYHWQRRLTRWAFSRANSIICVSQYTWDQMIALGVHPKQGRVIPNGADATRFAPLPACEIREFRQQLGLGDAQVLLTVGSVTERKGQDVVIKAMPHILKQIPDVYYLIAGALNKQAEFEQLARSLKVHEHVHFLGQVPSDTLVRVVNSCDVFVMTSKHTDDGGFEGYGIAVVEAALCGKPAVVANNSGLVEAIVHGQTGLAVAERDEVATAAAILTLLRNHNLRKTMGKAARDRALREQTWEYRIKEYDRLLTDLRIRTAAREAKGVVKKTMGSTR